MTKHQAPAKRALIELAAHLLLFVITLSVENQLREISGQELWTPAAAVLALSLVRPGINLWRTGPIAVLALLAASLLLPGSVTDPTGAVSMGIAFVAGGIFFRQSQQRQWPGHQAEVAWFVLSMAVIASTLAGLFQAVGTQIDPTLAESSNVWFEWWRQTARDATGVIAFGPVVIGQYRGRHKEVGLGDWALTAVLGAAGGALAFLSPGLTIGDQEVLSLAAVPAIVTAFALGRMPTYVVINMTGAGGTLGLLLQADWDLEVGLATYVVASALVAAIASVRGAAEAQATDHQRTTVAALDVDLPSLDDHRRVVAETFRTGRIVALVALAMIEALSPADSGLPAFISLLILGVLFLGPNALSLYWDRTIGQVPQRRRSEVALDGLAIVVSYGLLVDGPTTAAFPIAVALMSVIAALRLPPRTAALVSGVVATILSCMHLGVFADVMPAVPGHDLTDVVIAAGLAIAITFTVARTVSSLAELHLRSRDAALELDALHADLEASRASLEQFANVVAHDVKGPVTTAVHVTDAIVTLDMSAEDALDLAKEIAPSLRRTLRLVDRLHDHARASTVTLEPTLTSLSELAKRVIDDNEAGIEAATATVVVVGELPDWTCDEVLVEQALGNLIRNALRHARTESNPSPRVEVTATVADDHVHLTVADDGPGISVEVRDELFEIGSTTSPTEGLGLGLATCRAVARRHGGDLAVGTSSLGGASFTLSLATLEPETPWSPELATWYPDPAAAGEGAATDPIVQVD